MRIVAVAMVKDEDVWIGKALLAVKHFADEVVVIDNGSRDHTLDIVAPLATELVAESDPKKSHRYVERYVGTDTWVFGVDGDEIYDPAGLVRVRSMIERGDFDGSFQVLGQYLHARKYGRGVAEGYAGPPSHTPTKLYNFRHVMAWSSDGTHTLFHCKPRVLAAQVVERDERFLAMPWEQCPLRCVHVRFMRRSSAEPRKVLGRRPTPEDLTGHGSTNDRGKTRAVNGRKMYRRGPVVKVRAW